MVVRECCEEKEVKLEKGTRSFSMLERLAKHDFRRKLSTQLHRQPGPLVLDRYIACLQIASFRKSSIVTTLNLLGTERGVAVEDLADH